MEDSSEEEKEERDEADTSTFRGNTFLEMPPVRRTKKTLTSSQSSTEDNAFQTFQTQTLASSVLLRNPNIDIVQSSQNNNNTNFDAELHIYIKKRDFALNFDKQSVEVTKKLLPTTLFLSKYAEHFIEPISRNSWISIFEEKLLPEIK
ncbi:hypothetical protein RhiirA4_467011 [Rhizophagus irregularis]|uniref:Uncharacterized protein n=1 Tax=Rhizophagus irregularis TaxID=588596 RepID=A0A2I1GV95_9GLOM|nr:hypothetical protein RhiirA4_467011 [Rhizophagus irregularis]